MQLKHIVLKRAAELMCVLTMSVCRDQTAMQSDVNHLCGVSTTNT